jgi:UDP-N-acetylmuramate--alanine ligase
MKHIHLIGIGGTGISSIARVLLERGYKVTGSDRTLSPLALDLEIHGARVFEGHDAANIKGADLVVRSSAIPDNNVEVIAAVAAGIPVLKRSDFLADLMHDQVAITVAGSHGKTTTTTLMAYTLNRLNLDPSYIIGGVSKDLSNSAHAGKGVYFVIEADEYDRMFLGLRPHIAIVTNVEYDHPDCYPTPALYREAFADFVKLIPEDGLLVICKDDPNASKLVDAVQPGTHVITFGYSEGADYRAVNPKPNTLGGFDYDLVEKGKQLAHVSLQIPGEHNARNSVAILAAIHELGFPVDRAAANLSRFTGTGRRFDVIGEANGVTIVDDYAHHPSKISATLSAARARYPQRRLVTVWQPHTYSRTHTLEKDFIRSLNGSDVALITEIYAAREPKEKYSAADLVKQMAGKDVTYCKTLDDAVSTLSDRLLPGDVLLVLSAGDANQICKRMLGILQEKEKRHD